MPSVNIPDAGIVNFPDEMSTEDISTAAKGLYDGARVRKATEAMVPVLNLAFRAVKGFDLATMAGGIPETPVEPVSPETESAIAGAQAGMAMIRGGARQGASTLLGRIGTALTTGIPFRKVTAQEVADAFSYLASASPELTNEEAETVEQHISTPGNFEKIVAGAQQAATDIPTAFTSPLGIATLSAGAFGTTASRVVAGAFALDMARQIPGHVKEFAGAIKTGDPEAITRTGGSLFVNVLMTGSTARHAAGRDIPGIRENEIAPPPPRPTTLSIVAPQTAKATAATEPTTEPKPGDIIPGTEFKPGEREALAPETSVVSEKDITNLADSKGIPWDYDEKFMAFTEKLTGKKLLSELTPDERRTVYDAISKEPITPALNPLTTKAVEAGEKGLENALHEPAEKIFRPLQQPPGEGQGQVYAPSGSQEAAPRVGESGATGTGEARPTPSGEPGLAPAPEPMAGPGGTTPEDVGGGPELGQLTATLAGVKSKKLTWAEKLKQSSGLAQTWEMTKNIGNQALAGIKGAAAAVWDKFINPPKVNDWTRAIGKWGLEDQKTSFHARQFIRDLRKAVPDLKRREAINNWIDTGGDMARLEQAAAEVPDKYKQGYIDAQHLTPDELVLAKNVRNYFEAMLDHAIENGLFEEGVENYIHRFYEPEDPSVKKYIQELKGLRTTPALAKKRFYQFDYDAEKAGKAPVKDFAERVLAYDQAFNKAIAARAFVKAVREIKMPDGRPMVDTAGVGIPMTTQVEFHEGAPVTIHDATLIKPTFKPGSDDPIDNRADYIEFDHPAFRKWKWVAKDAGGQPILMQGNMLVHPDALTKFSALFDRSWWRMGPKRRLAMGASTLVKQTKLSLSTFHPVQIATHAAEHREVPFKTVDIDFQDPKQSKLVESGLIVADPAHLQSFSEGLTGTALTERIPFIGPRLHAFNDWLFMDFIPRTKMTMALDALDRNQKRFAGDLQSGKMSEDQLYRLTAEQANAAFGEQNYRLLGRHPTYQDTLRVLLLAPDFLEARARFAGQALTKYGTEQRVALLLGAAAIYTVGRFMNKALDDEWHFDKPFSVIYKGREYQLRTVQGDLWNAFTDPGRFAEHRLNPLYSRTLAEFLSGRNWSGEKRDFLQQAEDLADQIVPISLSQKAEDSAWTTLMNGLGLPSRQFSRQTEIQQLARKYMKDQGRPDEVEVIQAADAPFRKLKIALRADNPKAAAKALDTLLETHDIKAIRRSMLQSIRQPFTGSKEMENDFKASLTDAQLKAYEQALEERRELYDRFLSIGF